MAKIWSLSCLCQDIVTNLWHRIWVTATSRRSTVELSLSPTAATMQALSSQFSHLFGVKLSHQATFPVTLLPWSKRSSLPTKRSTERWSISATSGRTASRSSMTRLLGIKQELRMRETTRQLVSIWATLTESNFLLLRKRTRASAAIWQACTSTTQDSFKLNSLTAVVNPNSTGAPYKVTLATDFQALTKCLDLLEYQRSLARLTLVSMIRPLMSRIATKMKSWGFSATRLEAVSLHLEQMTRTRRSECHFSNRTMSAQHQLRHALNSHHRQL